MSRQQAPRLFSLVDPLLKEKLALALANREKEVNVVVGVDKETADTVLTKLRAMRTGLKQNEPKGSELQQLAANKHIRFHKEYSPARPLGFRHTVYITIYATESMRPSAAAAKALEDFAKGLRSTPY